MQEEREDTSRAAVRRPRRARVSREVSLYLVRGIVLYALVAFLVLDAVMGIVGTVRVTDKYNVPFLLILPLLLRAMGQQMIYTLPVALLFGTSLMVGRLRGDRELLSLQSFGISPAQLFLPIVLLGGFLSCISFAMNQLMVPHFRYDVRNVPSFVMDKLAYLGEGWGLDFSVGPYEIWVHHHYGAELDGVFLTARGDTEEGPISKDILSGVDTPTYPFYLLAERARVTPPQGGVEEYSIQLEGVNLYVDSELLTGESSDFVQRGHLATLNWKIPAVRKDRSIKDRDGGQLALYRDERLRAWRESERAGDAAGASRARSEYFRAVQEWHRRLTLALSCLTFPLAAFAIGMFVRSANRLLPFFLACTIVPANFFGLELVGSKLAEDGIIPWVTEHLGNIALIILTGIFFWLSAVPRR